MMSCLRDLATPSTPISCAISISAGAGIFLSSVRFIEDVEEDDDSEFSGRGLGARPRLARERLRRGPDSTGVAGVASEMRIYHQSASALMRSGNN